MKKSLIVLGTVAVITLSSAVSTTPVHAEPSNLQEVKTERKAIKANLTKAEGKIADILFDIKEMNEELAMVENALKENEKQVKQTNDAIEEFEREISVLQEEIDLLNIEIEKRNEILKTRIASYQKTGGNIGYLEVFFGAKDFMEFISRWSAVGTITKADNDLIQKQEEDRGKVKEHQDEIGNKLDEQEELLIELGEMEETILSQKKQAKEKKKDLEKQEKELKEEKSKLVSKDNSLALLESQIRGEITTYNRGSSSVSSNQSQAPKTISVANPVSSRNGNSAIAAGRSVIGTPYVYAGKGPGGFDCSGFVSWAYGGSIPSSTAGLRNIGTKVSTSNMQAGDLVFFNTTGRADSHVGIYVGGGNFIASNTTNGVEIKSLSGTYWKDTFKGHVRRIK